MTLQIGDLAPDFTLPDQNGEPVHLASLRGQRVVIYFYPKDATLVARKKPVTSEIAGRPSRTMEFTS